MTDTHKTDSRGTLIVTGAGRGIGAAVAKLAGARGFSVAVNNRGNEQAAADVAHHIVSAGGRASVIQADISRESEILRLFETAERELGPITGRSTTPALLEVFRASKRSLPQRFAKFLR